MKKLLFLPVILLTGCITTSEFTERGECVVTYPVFLPPPPRHFIYYERYKSYAPTYVVPRHNTRPPVHNTPNQAPNKGRNR